MVWWRGVWRASFAGGGEGQRTGCPQPGEGERRRAWVRVAASLSAERVLRRGLGDGLSLRRCAGSVAGRWHAQRRGGVKVCERGHGLADAGEKRRSWFIPHIRGLSSHDFQDFQQQAEVVAEGLAIAVQLGSLLGTRAVNESHEHSMPHNACRAQATATLPAAPGATKTLALFAN